jgi:thiamine pyrophosphate-dependent acetolactate synthase large subunit-like protein
MTQPANTSVNTSASRCQFRFANRKRCRLSTRNYDSFCPSHAKAHQIESTATELTANLNKLKSVEELHDFLARLLLLLAQNKISPRRAAVLAYITNQLLRTIHEMQAQADAARKNDSARIVIDMPRPNYAAHDDQCNQPPAS